MIYLWNIIYEYFEMNNESRQNFIILLDAAAFTRRFPWERFQQLHRGLETLDANKNANALFKSKSSHRLRKGNPVEEFMNLTGICNAARISNQRWKLSKWKAKCKPLHTMCMCAECTRD